MATTGKINTHASEGSPGHVREQEAARLRRRAREAARLPVVNYPPGHFTQGFSAWWPNPEHRPTGHSLDKKVNAAQLEAATAARAEGRGFGDGTFRGLSAASDERQTLRRLGVVKP